MMDVLCGGLGAMLLLMLLSRLDARRSSSAASEAQERAASLVGERQRLQAAFERVSAELAAGASASAERQRQLDGKILQLQTQLATAEKELRTAGALLLQAQADRQAMEKELATARGDRDAARGRVTDLQKRIGEADARMEALANRLEMTEKEKSEAVSAASTLAKLREELAEARQRAEALEADVARWRKEAAAAGVKVAAAEESGKKALLDAATLRQLLDDQQATAGRLRSELRDAANRFAGIDLSGRRIVILVDKSGSMASVESQKAAPDKWPALARTVSQVLRSMPSLEKFQLVVFSDQAEFPLGKPGDWLDFSKDSPAAAEQALLKLEPRGNTNMYAALEAAFRLKNQGLDAIYLFSDGLPNVGPGLPPSPPPDEAGQSALLGRYLRDTLKNRWNSAEPKVRIHSIGFFYESPNLGAFLWALSRENGGSFVGMSRP